MRRTGKRIFVGLESSGKSYLSVRESVFNLYRNHEWFKATGVVRPIRGNLAWGDKFYALAEKLQVPVLPWKHLAELPTLQGCDLYIDELATYFDSRTYKDLTLDIRLWLAQAEKMGVQIVGCAQDFGQVDVSFRRLCKEVFEVQKRFGSARPHPSIPSKSFVWGLISAWRLDPRSFMGEQTEMKQLDFFPANFLIRKKYVDMFDTGLRVQLSDPTPLTHVRRYCEDPTCEYHKKGILKHY